MIQKHQPWVPIEKIEIFVQIEPALVILGLVIGAWLVHKFFLREVSEERNRRLRELFGNILYHLGFGIFLYASFFALQQLESQTILVQRVTTYLGLGTIFVGAIIFVKALRILVFEYLYLSHMKVAFPVLLVNLFTLLISLILASWIGTEIFNIRLAPILATSAIFSLVLGLALQDTLGNLFAGVALQFDKPYGIGDWIEVHSGGHTWTGKVYEISWRATILTSFTEEFITIPNRVMGQAQISNFSAKYRPIVRSLVFRLPFSAEVDLVKKILFSVIHSVPEARRIPAPLVHISETTESWVSFKLIYHLDDFGRHFIVADKIYTKAIAELKAAGFELAGHRIITHLGETYEKVPSPELS